jgi:uncharacterized membrane protein
MTPTDDELKKQVLALEARVRRLEALLAPPATQESGDFIFLDAAPPTPPRTTTAPARPRPLPRPVPRPASPQLDVTQLLGWAGVTALVLAVAYLIKLGVDLGWLTPARQILLAIVGGVTLIGSGIVLRQADRHYASLLPAGGVVILFLATYGAHLYYRLIPFPAAIAGIGVICLLSLWLCQLFESELYAFFAVVGSYSAPLLLPGLRAEVSDLAIYYSAWSLLFCAYGLWLGQRRIYLTAAYLALLGFDLIWYGHWNHLPTADWRGALLFQAIQLAIFAGATALFTLRHQQPLDRDEAIVHLPPLLLFYALEYGLLDRYLPAWAPWIAVASLLLLLVIYGAARSAFSASLQGGQLILGVYAAVVLFHAGYLEVLPDEFAPWVALGVGAVAAAWLATQAEIKTQHWPLLAVAGVIFGLNALRAGVHFELGRVVAGDWLALAYALELYLGYGLLRRFGPKLALPLRAALLFAGHLAAMAAPIHLFDQRLAVSLTWAILAVAALFLALQIRDRLLGQSSLFIFAVSGAKVLLYDLSQSAPLIRIGCLFILGVSLYLGGWLYRKVDDLENSP